MDDGDRPPLTVVIASRDEIGELQPVFDALVPQARATSTEVIIVGGPDGSAPKGVRHFPDSELDIFTLRRRAIALARGELIAIGEDHAVPTANWCEAVIRAHREHPEAAAIVGCLINATDRTWTGRANFLGFAAPVEDPIEAPLLRPPPLSTLTLKRDVVVGHCERNGDLEARLVPQLFSEGAMVIDRRIVVDHHQDFRPLEAVRNSFDGARSAYGYLRTGLEGTERWRLAGWCVRNWPIRILGEARRARRVEGLPARELAMVAALGAAIGVGGAVGALIGPGRSADRVA